MRLSRSCYREIHNVVEVSPACHREESRFHRDDVAIPATEALEPCRDCHALAALGLAMTFWVPLL
jgi:hypothetical protein